MIKRSGACFVAVTLGLAAVLALPSREVASAPGVEIEGASLRTVAGNGLLGMLDGPADAAEFLAPVAIAVAHDGSLLVVDQAAQRIRQVSHGVVTTLAGTGPNIEDFGHVVGGYRDGPAQQAQFNEPSGIAVDQDGAIYVTDQLNHCIRKIQNGNVTTFAGSPEHPGNADGALGAATFKQPSAIAIASDGTMFVADYAGGLREISKSGTVSTLSIPGNGDQRLTGVAVYGAGKDSIVAMVSLTGLYASIKPAVPGSGSVFNGSEGGARPFLFGIAPIDATHFIATDVYQNAIRLVRYPDPPFVTQPTQKLVAGAAIEEAADSGGFADGPLNSAKFYEPLGIAVSHDSVFVADSGNRRIREMPLPDARGPISSSAAELQQESKTYRIATIGASHSFWASNWDQSIPGMIEAGLDRDRQIIGLSRHPKVSVIRLDASGVGVQADFLSSELSDGQVNLVIMLLRVNDLDSVAPKAGEDVMMASIRTLKELKAKLKAAGTELFVNVRSDSFVASQIDDISDREGRGHVGSAASDYDELKTHSLAILKASGVSFGLDLDDYVTYGKLPNRLQLWSFQDSHENLNGRRFAAANVLREIEAEHPWKTSPR